MRSGVFFSPQSVNGQLDFVFAPLKYMRMFVVSQTRSDSHGETAPMSAGTCVDFCCLVEEEGFSHKNYFNKRG
jgi:hypothetical protein